GAGASCRNVAPPVRALEPLRAKLGRPRREAEVRQRAAPTLCSPVRPVGCLAGGDDVGKRRTVVLPADAGEGLPVLRVVLAPAARVVELELHLLLVRLWLVGV